MFRYFCDFCGYKLVLVKLCQTHVLLALSDLFCLVNSVSNSRIANYVIRTVSDMGGTLCEGRSYPY